MTTVPSRMLSAAPQPAPPWTVDSRAVVQAGDVVAGASLDRQLDALGQATPRLCRAAGWSRRIAVEPGGDRRADRLVDRADRQVAAVQSRGRPGRRRSRVTGESSMRSLIETWATGGSTTDDLSRASLAPRQRVEERPSRAEARRRGSRPAERRRRAISSVATATNSSVSASIRA